MRSPSNTGDAIFVATSICEQMDLGVRRDIDLVSSFGEVPTRDAVARECPEANGDPPGAACEPPAEHAGERADDVIIAEALARPPATSDGGGEDRLDAEQPTPESESAA